MAFWLPIINRLEEGTHGEFAGRPVFSSGKSPNADDDSASPLLE